MDAMKWLEILSALAKFAPIPYAGLAGELGTIFVKLMADIKEKTGLSDAEIMEKANITGIANQQMIDLELARLSALDTQPLGE
jgi:hypothetical protein